MSFSTTTGYGSTTSIDYFHAPRGGVAFTAASDIFAGTPVYLQQTAIGSVTAWGGAPVVNGCASSADHPIGIAADNAAAGTAVTVYDAPNYPRLVVSGSVNAAMEIGVINTSSAVHPVSGVVGLYPVLGQVSGASYSNIIIYGVSSTTTYNAVWSIGQALESGNPGQGVLVSIAPRLLSGLAS